MKKKSMHEHLSYWFDCVMSKGTFTRSIFLFLLTTAIVFVIGILGYFVSGEGSSLYQIWNSLMYTLDPGNLSGVPTDNISYLFLMFLATLSGLFLTSVLIGIITTGIEDKLSKLRKGTSIVQEENHTVIIGFDNNIYTILNELIEANSNKKNACVVILGEQNKDEMEDAISSHISKRGTTRIICRSGNLFEAYALKRCSVETCKSVIVNVSDDAETVKILLALSAYIKNRELTNKDLKFIVSLQNDQYIEAAKIAGEGNAEIIYAKDAIARIISNTCRQHGLSQVLTELFNFSGNELYFERVPELEGKTFKEATMSFANAMAVGLYVDGKAMLNPSMDTIIEINDEVILLELDDGIYKYHQPKVVDETKICNKPSIPAYENQHLIIFGSNDKLPIILAEYEKYVGAGTRIVIVDDELDEKELKKYKALEIVTCTESFSKELLFNLLDCKENNILLLSDDNQESEKADSKTLLKLILLRDIADQKKRRFTITTEMCNVSNQRLASPARVDDFVIGTNLISLLMTQISDNPKIAPLIDELLDESGSELYMKPVVNYVSLDVPIDSYTLTESAARKGEIYIGYRHNGKNKTNVILNPNKDEKIVFHEDDQIVVIAQN